MTTLVKVLLIASESNGGLPTNKVYNMHPKLHTSASGPCDDLVATYEFTKRYYFIVLSFIAFCNLINLLSKILASGEM